jgi:hypothetical protein
MADCWELEDGSGRWELEDGTGCWLLEDDGAQAGIIIQNTHASPRLVIRRQKQLIPVEFSFILKAGLIRSLWTQFQIQANIIVESVSKIPLKAGLLLETYSFLQLRANTTISTISEKVNLKAGIIIPIKEHSINLISNIKNPKIKKVLLSKLKELLDEDGANSSLP